MFAHLPLHTFYNSINNLQESFFPPNYAAMPLRFLNRQKVNNNPNILHGYIYNNNYSLIYQISVSLSLPFPYPDIIGQAVSLHGNNTIFPYTYPHNI